MRGVSPRWPIGGNSGGRAATTPVSPRHLVLALAGLCCVTPAGAALSSGEVHVSETQEITLRSAED